MFPPCSDSGLEGDAHRRPYGEFRMPFDYSAPHLPTSLKADRQGDVGILWLAHDGKHDAVDEQTILGIEAYFSNLAHGIKAVVLANEAAHFSTGLDLNELKGHGISDGIKHSRLWQRAFDSIQYGSVPVVAVLQGALVGAGLELAYAAHVRVAERSAVYALPEEVLGFYFNGSTAVRLLRLIGVARVMDMMLTGRRYSAEEGQAIGLSTYLVDNGKGFEKGVELAERIANNANCSLFSSVRG